jgi:hypothetical protein
MKRLKSRITYEAENTEQGALLRITTHEPEALPAIHSFLSFQIHDHRFSSVGPAAKLNPPAARPVDAVASIEAIAIPTAQFRLLKEFMVNL